jgi:hypothetical protein
MTLMTELDYIIIIFLKKFTMAKEENTCEWKTNSGRSNKCKLHTIATPSGSFIAIGFLLYEATHNSGF